MYDSYVAAGNSRLIKEEVCGVLEKLEAIENHYEELTLKLGDPDILSDQTRYLALMKEHADLTEVVEKTREYRGFLSAREDALAMFDDNPDDELRDMIKEELRTAEEGIARLEALDTLTTELEFVICALKPKKAEAF